MRPSRRPRSRGARAALARSARDGAPVPSNVVAVYDLVVHRSLLVLAMELVEGQTLRERLASERRWRKVLPLYLQAGRGLAAAHAVGIVHRDFKPENVLVGADGRARVTDFGLARTVGGGHPLDAISALHKRASRPPPDALGRAVTRTGTVLGTAVYMAPEQQMGHVDERSDQFAFCASLYEALTGALPFEGDDLEQLRSAMLHTRPKPMPARSAPPWLQRVILRGLSFDPNKRFPSMAALLEALEADPAVRRRRWLYAGAVGLGVIAAALGAVAGYRHVQQRAASVCRVDGELDGVWDGPRRDAARKAFEASPKPYARDVWASTERILDGYATSWTASRRDACEATEVRHQQPAAVEELRMACLDERREELRELVEQLTHPDDALVSRAVSAASSLTSLDRCADARLLHGRPEPPAAARERATELRRRLAHVKALRNAGRYPEALASAKQLLSDTQPLGYPALEADILVEVGEYEMRTGDMAAAEATLYKAAWTADAAGNDHARAWAWVTQAYNVGYLRKERQLTPLLRDQAIAATKRVPGDVELEGALQSVLGSLLLDDDKPAEARAAFELELELHEKAHGKDCPHAYLALANLGLAYRNENDARRALEVYDRALALAEKTGGPQHPDVATVLTHMGGAHSEIGDVAKAEELHRRSLSVLESSLGPQHPGLSMPLGNLARALIRQGRFDEAVPLAERSLSLREKSLGPTAPKLIYPLSALGSAYEGAGDHAQAAAVLERALALPDAGAPALMARAEVKFNLARALRAMRKADRRARALALEARSDLLAARGGAGQSSPYVDQVLAEIDAWLARRTSAKR